MESDAAAAQRIRELDAQLMAAYTNAYLQTSWYSAARPHIAGHVRDRLGELSKIYRRLQQVPGAPLHEWAKERVEAIPDFAEDFDRFPGDWRWVSRSFGAAQTAASVTFVVLPALGVTVAVTTSSALLLAIVNACFCKLWMVFFLSLFAGLFFYVIVGFWNKRKILAKEGVDPVSTSPSVYELEEQLMRALGTQRRGEVQFDVVGTFAVSALYLGMYALGSWLESFVGFRWHFDWQWYFHPLLWAAICGGLGILLAIESRDRRWGWRG